MILKLRGYQEKAIENVKTALRKHRSVVLTAPTGSGKTVLTAHMIRGSMERGLRSWFIVHRKELLEQTSKALWDLSVPHGKIMAGERMTADPVQVASVQTLVRRIGKLSPPNMVVVDEAHHATAASYKRILDHCDRSWVIGLTATPSRTDGTGLSDVFQALVLGPSTAELIRDGYLSSFRIVAPAQAIDMKGVRTRAGDWDKEEMVEILDRAQITGDAVAHYRRYVEPGTCLIYCISRKHAKHVTEVYRSHGIDAEYVAGDTPKAERDRHIAGFRNGSPRIIVSVDLFGEGLDVPGLNAVQLLRPTQSLGLHLQQIGRALRIEEGKPQAVVLDHVGNSWRHGLPDDERVWTLEGEKRKKRGSDEAEIQLRHCPECFSIFSKTLTTCPVCGWEVVGEDRKVEEVDGQLVEFDADEHRRKREKLMEQGSAETLEELVALAKRRGHKPAWAGYVYATRNGMPKNETIRRAYAIARKLRAS